LFLILFTVVHSLIILLLHCCYHVFNLFKRRTKGKNVLRGDLNNAPPAYASAAPASVTSAPAQVTAQQPSQQSAQKETAQVLPSPSAPAANLEQKARISSPSANQSTTAPQAASLGVVSSFVPPVPVAQTPIQLPDILKTAVRNKPQEVVLLAHIDSSGRVKSLGPKGALTGLQENLYSIARPAVMGWRFRPAKLGDRDVDSEFVLRLKFGGAR